MFIKKLWSMIIDLGVGSVSGVRSSGRRIDFHDSSKYNIMVTYTIEELV